MRICMASDFFYPNIGGVEEHIFNLSQCLIANGHKIIVITHSYGDRKGVRYMTNGLKVYYLPIKVFYNQCILPTMICNIPLLRNILLREQIDIVHGHSAFSALAHETMFVGKLLGLRTVFTDHSLFGFADLSAIVTNKFIEISLATCNRCICVSYIGKENTVLRAGVLKKLVGTGKEKKVLSADVLKQNQKVCNKIYNKFTGKENTVLRAGVLKENQKVNKFTEKENTEEELPAGVLTEIEKLNQIFVIPNAVDSAQFTPNPSKRSRNKITIIIASRLVYRKGIDFLVEIIPRFENTHDINFIIAGDGPKRDLLEEVIENCNMQNRVEFKGAVKHSEMRDILTCGHIFLNTSLTEAFCMAIIEAASCGLQVVSTNVGGIPEVLPSNLIILTEPNADSIYKGVLKAIQNQKKYYKSNCKIEDTIMCPYERNEMIRNFYDWEDVTKRTEKVYEDILKDADPCLGEKLCCYLRSGVWPFLLIVSLSHLIIQFLDWLQPRFTIEIAREFPRKKDIQRE